MASPPPFPVAPGARPVELGARAIEPGPRTVEAGARAVEPLARAVEPLARAVEQSVAEPSPSGADSGRGPRSSGGFRGQLRCSSIADLIQLECLSGERAVVIVKSPRGEGLFFFDGGCMVHAVQGELLDEAAALEILRWDGGTFEPSEAAWPERPPMTSPWQHLVLLAAQREDESLRAEALQSRREPGTLTPESRTERIDGARRPGTLRQETLRPGTLRQETLRQETPRQETPRQEISRRELGTPTAHLPSGRPPRPPSPITQQPTLISAPSKITMQPSVAQPIPRAALQLGPAGELLQLRGEANRLVPLAAYLRHLADLIGADLGGRRFASMSCQMRSRHVWLFAEANGTCLVVEAAPDVPSEFVHVWFEQMRTRRG
jgi:Domain of unknown function (DUF4388)